MPAAHSPRNVGGRWENSRMTRKVRSTLHALRRSLRIPRQNIFILQQNPGKARQNFPEVPHFRAAPPWFPWTSAYNGTNLRIVFSGQPRRRSVPARGPCTAARNPAGGTACQPIHGRSSGSSLPQCAFPMPAVAVDGSADGETSCGSSRPFSGLGHSVPRALQRKKDSQLRV